MECGTWGEYPITHFVPPGINTIHGGEWYHFLPTTDPPPGVVPIASAPRAKRARPATTPAPPRRRTASGQFAAPSVVFSPDTGLGVPAPGSSIKAIVRNYVNQRKAILAYIRGAKLRSRQLLAAIRTYRPPRPRRARMNV